MKSLSLLESRELLVFMSGGLVGVVEDWVGVAGETGSTLKAGGTVDEGECCSTSGSVPDRLRVSGSREGVVEFVGTTAWGVWRS